MIVKNEQNFLRGCLESVKNVVNEIVIVDTGSTDKTMDIAREFGATIIQKEWEHSFSKARNVSLAHALGRWILYLDADERLTQKSIPELLKIVEGRDRIVYSCLVTSHYKIFNKTDVLTGNRLFLNIPGIQFQNLVHEEIWWSAKKLYYDWKASGIEIEHLGYDIDRKLIQQKATRNLALLLVELKDHYTPLKVFETAQCYGVLGDYEKVREYLLRVLAFGKKKVKPYHWIESERMLRKLKSLRVRTF